MTAFMDCMIFLMIMMMAITVTATVSHQSVDDGIDPEQFLNMFARTEVRLSDLTDIEDDSLVYMTDVIAYSTYHQSTVPEYLENLLDSAFGSHRYSLRCDYEGNELLLGDGEAFFRHQSSIEVPVSTGGRLSMILGTL